MVLVDDGLATGSTMRAAVAALRRHEPARIVVAVPIGARSTCDEVKKVADDAFCAITPDHFRAVGLWYDDFEQTDDDEVCSLLAQAAQGESQIMKPESEGNRSNAKRSISVGERTVRGTADPANRGFRRGRLRSWQRQRSIQSPKPVCRPRFCKKAGLATLLLDLLEEDEAGDRSKVFDIVLLAGRLQAAADWLATQPETTELRLGYFGASTGAGAALRAAAASPQSVGAIVSRGGRPDLAGEVLPRVTAPTLLIVGGDDEVVLELNREAFEKLECSPAARCGSGRHPFVCRAG